MEYLLNVNYFKLIIFLIITSDKDQESKHDFFTQSTFSNYYFRTIQLSVTWTTKSKMILFETEERRYY